ncbi:7TM diverse intracellular signaling domain-containing protein [Thalassobellus citreus]|uniref:7TM diverse intracellular signaling domain-containing protein n=1 Tax=Thalassobellus citreus TaxID=3367752 RepID=UPI0037905650
MKNKRNLNILLILLVSIIFSSCSHEKLINVDYSFKVAKDVKHSIHDFNKVDFTSDNNLDLGFYTGQIWIKLEIENGRNLESIIVLCNDLINHNYRFYKLNKKNQSFIPQKELDIEKYDHRSYLFAKPNFKIDLEPYEKGTFLISTTSDGRILQATPKLVSIDEFVSIKQQVLIFDIVFYCFVILLLIINLLYFRLVTSNIYLFYAAYIISGCLMYLFVEGRLYGLGLSNFIIDHLMFISIRVWIISSVLFTLNFLETKKTNPSYYKFIILMLLITLGGTTIYQLLFYDFSISTLHQFENIIGFVWILLSLTTVSIAFKKRKTHSIYYLISYSAFLLFVTFGLLDSHTTILPGDPFSYFKIGTILEFIGFTYFISLLIKKRLLKTEKLAYELSQNHKNILEKEKLLIARNNDLVNVLKVVENSFSNEADWDNFKERFKLLNPNFISTLSTKYPNLTKSEIRLLTLIRIGYSQKEIATILNIAPDSVKKARSRVRKKLNLEDKEQLNTYIKNIST